jgi:hypothetical protein
MATGMTSEDAFELKSVMQQILAQMKDTAAGTTEYSKRTAELIASEELNRQATNNSTKAANRSADRLDKLGVHLTTLGSGLVKFGGGLDKFTKKLETTQKDLGLTIGNSAKLQADVLISTVKDFSERLTNINFQAIGEGLKIAGGGLMDVFAGKGFAGIEDTINKLNQPIPGPIKEAVPLPSERLAAIQAFQNEFGVINKTIGESLAQYAKTYGVSVQSLVQARRTFATIARGDLSQVDRIQTRFLDVFRARGMTPKVALEVITKNAELIARSGLRFAESFARAAASAKLIGVDLGKVDQVGDNIIDNFEGFLESQAELGAMGFGFDTSRLAQLAETGDTGTLFNELRTQLAMTGKDINNLRRSERLALESAFGINISELQRLAGGTPEVAAEDLQQTGNTYLQEILTLVQIGGPIFSFLSDMTKGIVSMVNFLNPTALLTSTVVSLLLWAKYKGNQREIEIEKLKMQGRELLNQGSLSEGAMLLEEASRKEQAGKMFEYGPSGILRAEEVARATQKEIEFYKILSQGKGPRYTTSPEISPVLQSNGFLLPQTYSTTSNPFAPPVKKASGGLVTGPGTEKSDSIPAKLSNGEYVVNALATKMPGVKSLLDKINFGREGGLKNVGMNLLSSSLNRFTPQLGLGSLSKKVPGLSNITNLASSFSSLRQGGISGLATKGLGLLSKKVPGLSNITNLASSFKTGGIGGAVGSLAKAGIGKTLGGLIGTAIPIPGVGTAIGSLVGSKVGGMVGRLFGRKKKAESFTDAGTAGITPQSEGFNIENIFRSMVNQRPQETPTAPVVVDTRGIEQKLNNFIAALQNIQINMDGAQVGKVLVNASEAAMSTGVFRVQSR